MSFYLKGSKLLKNKVKRRILDLLNFSWNTTQNTQAWQSVCCSYDGSKLAAVVYGGYIYTSSDGGVSWTQRENQRLWKDISCSYDGSKLIAIEYTGKIYISLDSGISWSPKENNRQWISVVSNFNFGKLVAAVENGQIYISSNSGTSWTPVLTNQNWSCVSVSDNGSKIIASVYEGYLYTSIDGGSSWTERSIINKWTSCSAGAVSSIFAACAIDSPLYISSDNGLSWTQKENNRHWNNIHILSDGSKIFATTQYSDDPSTGSPGKIYCSFDSGETWTTAQNNRYWTNTAVTYNFNKIIGVETNGQIHIGSVNVNNTIYNHINSSVISRLSNKNPSNSRSVYTSSNPYYNNIGQFIRNPDCWINGVDNISCFSPAQMSGANWYQRAGTLITTKHILLAKHFTIAILPNGGTPIIFVDSNNNVIRRNLINYGFDTDIGGVTTDIAIGLLDNDVPSNIKIAKVLPKNYTKYLDIIAPLTNVTNEQMLNYGPYAVGLDQESKAILKWVMGKAAGSQGISVFNASTLDPYYSFTESVTTGDSGQPVFLIIDNELVVLTTWQTTAGGPFITLRYDAVNSIIDSLSPGEGYSLTPIDLAYVYNKYR